LAGSEYSQSIPVEGIRETVKVNTISNFTITGKMLGNIIGTQVIGTQELIHICPFPGI